MLSRTNHFAVTCTLLLVSACGGGGGGGGGDGGGTTPPTAFAVSATASGIGSGSITPTSRTVPQGGSTSFTVVPNSDSTVAGVSGCGGVLSGSTYTTGPVSSNCTVIATFGLRTYGVTTSLGNGGSISPTSADVSHGGTTSFTVTSNSGFEIASVTGCQGTLSGSTYQTGPITGACSVSASFRESGAPPSPTFDVTTLVTGNGSGQITPGSAQVAEGQTASFTITPNAGSDIASVTGCVGTLNGASYTTEPITSSCIVTAEFNLRSYTITATATSGGLISPSSLSVTHGSSANFTIAPESGFAIGEITGCGGSLSGSIYTTVPVTAGCAVSAAFVPRTAALLTTRAQPGAVSLTWPSVAGVNYNVYYSTAPRCNIENYNSCPGGTLLLNAISPHVVADLVDGTSYWFILESVFSDGTIASAEVGARPDSLNTDGTVYALAAGEDDTIYLGGYFSRVGVRTGNGVPVNRATGAPGAFPIVNSRVSAVASDGQGGWYIGGMFTEVGGQSRNRLAHVLRDGTLGPWNPDANGVISTIDVRDNTIYVGGDFTVVAGAPRNRLAAISPDGTLLAWSPNANDFVSAIATTDDAVYIAGQFTSLNGEPRVRLASVDRSGALRDWRADANGIVHAIGITGNVVYIGGYFTQINGVRRTDLAAIGTDGVLRNWGASVFGTVYALAAIDDTIYVGGSFSSLDGVPRNNVAAISTDNVIQPWSPNPSAAVYSIAKAGNTIYVGGEFSSIGGAPRRSLAAISVDGTVLTWNPGADGTVSALAVSSDAVYVGGVMSSFDGESRVNLAAIGPDGTLKDWSPSPNQTVRSIAVDNDIVYVGGEFSSVSGVTRNRLAAIGADGMLHGWRPNVDGWGVYALAVSDGMVYAGGEFTSIDGQPRSRLAAIAPSGSLSTLNLDANSTVTTLVSTPSLVYVGGEFSRVSGAIRGRLAALGSGGVLTDWAPNVNDFYVNALSWSSTAVYVGGDFTRIGEVQRNGLAAIDADGAVSSTWIPNIEGGGAENPSVNALGYHDGLVYVGGNFTKILGADRWFLGAVEASGSLSPWNPSPDGRVRAILVRQGTIYIGGDFFSVGGLPSRGFAKLTPP